MAAAEIFIAKRYLRSKRKIRFINVIGYISIGGIAIGVAALLVALSVFNGFGGVVTSVLVGFDPHVRIEKRGSLTETELSSIEANIVKHSEVKAYAPFLSGKAMLVTPMNNKVVFIRGVDEKRLADVSGLQEKMVLGSISFKDSESVGGIVIGLTLADRLGVVLGEELSMISPYGFQSSLAGLSAPQMVKFRVTGIFESNNRDYDASYAYLSIAAAQNIFHREGKVDGIEMRLHDINNADRVKEELGRELPTTLTISTWYDLHQSLYSVMKMERWCAYVLLSLIVLVASFNMLGSLTMGVIEKKRDIGVLKAMGMTSKGIVRLFMFEGILIGVIGTALGVVLGLVVLWLQVKYQIFPLDPTVYIIPAIPVDIHWTDFVSIALASLGFATLAAYYPARRAASTIPTDALRWE
jgi:lipoprotein-releasing system permease protein